MIDPVAPVLEARGVVKYYERSARPVLILDRIDLELRPGEFVALLGPSGSGKSTLMRILAGLVGPSRGEVWSHGAPQVGVNPAVAIVFQSFALFPWLTVQENVELGLEARGVPRAERRERAVRAIDLIGLDGFESAYPKELSGGMRQRVGFARALVVEPEVLMMDEAFSALDVLTAANLREELLDLWTGDQMPMKAVLMVTHNIDEAVLMADRIIVLGHDPGRVRADLAVTLPRPRDLKSAGAQRLVDEIYRILTRPLEEPAAPAPPAPEKPYQFLPRIQIGSLNGLAEVLLERGGREDIFELGRDLQMEVDDLLPLIEVAELLELATVREGDIELTTVGRQLAEGDIQADKALFRQQITAHVDLVRRIMNGLRSSPNGRLEADDLQTELERFFSDEEAAQQLDTIVDWGRYAELFGYDEDSGELFLEADA